MSDTIFVDTNVLVYARDGGQQTKQERAAEWMAGLWRSRLGRLSMQVLQEFYVTVTQKLRPGLDHKSARSEVRAFIHWQPIGIGTPMVEGAWGVQDRFGLSWWDALIVSAAQIGGCRYLLSEGLQDGQDLDGVVVLSPFEHTASSLSL